MLIAPSFTAITDWTVSQPSLNSDKCITQVKNLNIVWTGDCEGSYAAMVASAVQDNICIAFDAKTGVDAKIKTIADVKVSYQDLICNCEICQQYSGKGCLGGNVEETLKYIANEGFVGGSSSTQTSQISITGVTWIDDFAWNYNNCLPFYKGYCEFLDGSSSACNPTNNPMFNKENHCGIKPTTGTDKMCPNSTSIKIKSTKQKKLIKLTEKVSGMANIKAAIDKGVLVSTMEITSDIFFQPKETVYFPMFGGSLGHFAVKIVGYVEVSGQAYWKVMLPFDNQVGKDGIVWVKAGLNIGDLEINAFKIVIETNLLKPPPPTL